MIILKKYFRRQLTLGKQNNNFYCGIGYKYTQTKWIKCRSLQIADGKYCTIYVEIINNEIDGKNYIRIAEIIGNERFTILTLEESSENMTLIEEQFEIYPKRIPLEKLPI